MPYPEASSSDLIHPPDFRPFFTLIDDPETGEHHHPGVHYIFSDDNPDFLTSAIIDTVPPQPASSDSSLPPANSSSTSVQERVVIIDVSADGKSITSAHSLSPDWQIASANVDAAPSWNEGTESRREGNLMLTLSGTESRGRNIWAYQQGVGKKGDMDSIMYRTEAVAAGYTERLGALDRLVRMDVMKEEDQAEDVHEGQMEKAQAGDEHDEESQE